MDVKGQGALEYLLLIGGAVLVAAIVIALITATPAGITNPQVQARCGAHALYAACQTDCDFTIGTEKWDCAPKKADGTPSGGAANFAFCGAEPDDAVAGCPT
jgi:hypothetical protein